MSVFVTFFAEHAGNIFPMIFWFLESNITYTLIIRILPNNLWYGICFTLAIVIVFNYVSYWQSKNMRYKCLLGEWEWCITMHSIRISILFYFILGMFLCVSNKNNKYGATYTAHTLYIYGSSNTHILSLLGVTWFLTCTPTDPNPSPFSDFKSDEYLNMQLWMVGSSYHWVLYFMF